jgi:hypothetical protein
LKEYIQPIAVLVWRIYECVVIGYGTGINETAGIWHIVVAIVGEANNNAT